MESAYHAIPGSLDYSRVVMVVGRHLEWEVGRVCPEDHAVQAECSNGNGEIAVLLEQVVV